MRVAAHIPVMLVLLRLGSTAAVAGESSCEVPEPPSCVSQPGSFEGQDEEDDCQRQLSSYHEEVQTHLQCVLDEYNAAVKEFDRRSSEE